MSNHLVLACSVCMFLSLVACGGDKPALGQTTPTAAGPAPSQPAAPTTPTAQSAESGPVVSKAPEPAPAVAPAGAPQGEAPKPLPRVKVDHDLVKALFGREPGVEEVDNPGTPEKVALGKALYHEKHLSKNGNLSCASCHDLANYGVDNKAKSPGSDGKDGERNTPTTWNAFRQFRQFWDGRAATVEEQSMGPVLNPLEHGIADEAQLVAKLKEKPELVEGFQKAFPGAGDPVSVANFKLAIGAFERTLVTRSKWDDYLDGNPKALNQDELFGLKTFLDVGCTTCHGTRLVGGAVYQKTGALKPFGSKDEGRGKLTGNDADKFFFKVPSLLNVERTSPYFHDGSVKTLEEVVKVMADIQLDKKLTDDQVRGLVAFLKALTGALPAEYAKK